MTIGTEHERLRNRARVNERTQRGFTICPTNAKAEMKVARELLHFVARPEWIFSGQSDELDVASGVFLPHLLVVRNLATTWPTPGCPHVDHDNFAGEVCETKSAVVNRLQFVTE